MRPLAPPPLWPAVVRSDNRTRSYLPMVGSVVDNRVTNMPQESRYCSEKLRLPTPYPTSLWRCYGVSRTPSRESLSKLQNTSTSNSRRDASENISPNASLSLVLPLAWSTYSRMTV